MGLMSWLAGRGWSDDAVADAPENEEPRGGVLVLEEGPDEKVEEFSVSQCARALGVTNRGVRHLIGIGQLRAHRQFGPLPGLGPDQYRWRVLGEDLEAEIQRRRDLRADAHHPGRRIEG